MQQQNCSKSSFQSRFERSSKRKEQEEEKKEGGERGEGPESHQRLTHSKIRNAFGDAKDNSGQGNKGLKESLEKLSITSQNSQETFKSNASIRAAQEVLESGHTSIDREFEKNSPVEAALARAREMVNNTVVSDRQELLNRSTVMNMPSIEENSSRLEQSEEQYRRLSELHEAKIRYLRKFLEDSIAELTRYPFQEPVGEFRTVQPDRLMSSPVPFEIGRANLHVRFAESESRSGNPVQCRRLGNGRIERHDCELDLSELEDCGLCRGKLFSYERTRKIQSCVHSIHVRCLIDEENLACNTKTFQCCLCNDNIWHSMNVFSPLSSQEFMEERVLHDLARVPEESEPSYGESSCSDEEETDREEEKDEVSQDLDDFLSQDEKYYHRKVERARSSKNWLRDVGPLLVGRRNLQEPAVREEGDEEEEEKSLGVKGRGEEEENSLGTQGREEGGKKEDAEEEEDL